MWSQGAKGDGRNSGEVSETRRSGRLATCPGPREQPLRALRACPCLLANADARQTRFRLCSYAREPPREPRRLLGMKLHHVLTVSLLAAITVACWSGAGGLATPGRLTMPVCPPPAACTEAVAVTQPAGGCDRAAKYDLSHLTQAADQRVLGPVQVRGRWESGWWCRRQAGWVVGAACCHPPAAGGCCTDPQALLCLTPPLLCDAGPLCAQDDEALLLYAITRGMRCRTVVEIGGLSGYSGRNFLAAS